MEHMVADSEGQATDDSAEALLWQALSLTRGLIHEMDDLEVELGAGVMRPMIEPLNRIDEIQRRIGAATIRLDATEGDDGELEALDELELALDAVADLRHAAERITQSPE